MEFNYFSRAHQKLDFGKNLNYINFTNIKICLILVQKSLPKRSLKRFSKITLKKIIHSFLKNYSLRFRYKNIILIEFICAQKNYL